MVAWMSRTRPALARPFLRGLGDFTLWVNGGRARDSLAAVGEEWQRMFPSKAMVPITRVDEATGTVHAEVRVHCPLRGSGDTAACHRMMEYDRRMLERIGGQLIVLHSQAEPGRTHCEVAIRSRESDVADLVPAHVRAPRRLPLVPS
jgi:hypothetical protein